MAHPIHSISRVEALAPNPMSYMMYFLQMTDEDLYIAESNGLCYCGIQIATILSSFSLRFQLYCLDIIIII